MTQLKNPLLNYRQVQSQEEVSSLFADCDVHHCRIWNSDKTRQLNCSIVRLGEKFVVRVAKNFLNENTFFIHCPNMTFAMKFKTVSETLENEEKVIIGTLIKWIRPEMRENLRQKVSKTKAYLYTEDSGKKIVGEVKNFNFYGCQIQFNLGDEEELKKLDHSKIAIKMKSENELTYPGSIRYLRIQNGAIFVGIHFPTGCSTKVQFDTWG